MTDGLVFQEETVWVGGEVKVKEKQSHWEGGSSHCYFPGQIPGLKNNLFFLSFLLDPLCSVAKKWRTRRRHSSRTFRRSLLSSSPPYHFRQSLTKHLLPTL